MKESFWGYLILLFGIFIVVIMIIIRDYQTTNDEDYYIMKEVTQAAMIDAIDYAYYREHNDLRIIEDKFAENFLRRFAESMSSNKTYKIQLFEISENPPKVSVKITTSTGEYVVEQEQGAVDFGVINILSAILDMKHDNVVYNNDYIEGPNGPGGSGDGSYVERTYYSVSYVSYGSRGMNYRIQVSPIPTGVDLTNVLSTTVSIQPMATLNDFDKYVQEKMAGNMVFVSGAGSVDKGVAEITPHHLYDHALKSSNFSAGATGECNETACFVNISTNIKNFDGVTPTGQVKLLDGTVRDKLYYVPVKFKFRFNLKTN